MRHDALVAALAASLALGAPTIALASPVSTVVEPFFEAVAREDLAAVRSFLAPDAKVEAVFNPNGQTGPAAVRTFPAEAYFTLVTRNYDNLVFTDRTYSVADDGGAVWMEAQGDLVVAATGQPYRNRYVFKLTIADGRVGNFREWVNTVTLTQQGIAARPEAAK